MYRIHHAVMDHRTIIDLWPSLRSFAEDIGVAYGTAKAMRRRNSMPAEYWPLAIERAAQRGIIDVTLDGLARGIPGSRHHAFPPGAAETPSAAAPMTGGAADAAAPPLSSDAHAWRLPLPPRGAHIWEILPHGLAGPVSPVGEKLRLEVWGTLPDPADRLLVVHDSCGLLEIALKRAEAGHLARLLAGEAEEGPAQPPPGGGDAPLTLGVGPRLVGSEIGVGHAPPPSMAKSLAACGRRVIAYFRRRHAAPRLSAIPSLGVRPRLPGSVAEVDAIAGAPRGRFLPVDFGRGENPGRFFRGGVR